MNEKNAERGKFSISVLYRQLTLLSQFFTVLSYDWLNEERTCRMTGFVKDHGACGSSGIDMKY